MFIIIIIILILRKRYSSTFHICRNYGPVLYIKHAYQDLRYFYYTWVYYFLFIFGF